MPFFAQLLAELLAIGPGLFQDVDNVFNNIAHGEGGAQKIAKTAASLSVLNTHLAQATAATKTGA